MAKITRQTFIQFGVNVNASADICQFGSPATGSPVYTNVISVLQALAAWTTGFAAETIANNRPFLEDFNAFCYVFSYFIAYLLQMGISEYDAGTTYYLYSITQFNGVVYQCTNDNSGAGISGIVPTTTANWKQLQTGYGSWVSKSLSTVYQAATDGILVVNSDIQGNGVWAVAIYTDSSPTPATSRVGWGSSSSTTELYGSYICPIIKGNYYEVVANAGGSVYFLSSGS